jgi:hypothetical protein
LSDVSAAVGAEITCSNPQCRVSDTGKCIEGLELTECSHYGEQVGSGSGDVGDGVQRAAQLGIGLPHGNFLDIPEACGLLLRGQSRVIAIIGPKETGKTSLIAGLYDLFQGKRVGDVAFAGSKTLQAFERVCHDARLASRRNVPHMERTSHGQVVFYHLALSGGSAGEGVTLLLADRAGEEYRAVTDDLANVADLPEIPRADTLTVLVDGERLLDDGMRHNLKSDIALILQGMVDGGAIVRGQRIALVLTKLDSITVSPQKERAERDFDVLHTHIVEIIGEHAPVIEKFKIAAYPKTTDMPRGEGLAALLDFWLAPPIGAEPARPAMPKFTRAIARVKPADEDG